jgi:hypothetical protein
MVKRSEIEFCVYDPLMDVGYYLILCSGILAEECDNFEAKINDLEQYFDSAEYHELSKTIIICTPDQALGFGIDLSVVEAAKENEYYFILNQKDSKYIFGAFLIAYEIDD